MDRKNFYFSLVLLIISIAIGTVAFKKVNGNNMLILKHVEYEIKNINQLEGLLAHIKETTSQVKGVSYENIYFIKDKKEFVIFFKCESEKKYLEWRKLCPPPIGAKDWYEVLLTKDEFFFQ
ncbi:MAG: hypothetical protein HY934_03725 [Candidatus Firestonebacteria bacterium]|nr:hypothetical protein [Candidatus Firestonebacteria bacterium]